MNVLETIKARRSIGKVKPDPVAPELIEQLLEAAVHAPNHYDTQPWRFFVLTGEGRRVLGRAYAEIASEELTQPDDPAKRQEFLRKQEEKAFRAPVVIAVAAVPSDQSKVERIEELGAAYAAAQNILLTAYSLGLGAILRSGKPMYHPRMKQAFGLREQDALIGLIYVGYPADDVILLPRERSYQEKTVWITDSE
jgi:nitroreductase